MRRASRTSINRFLTLAALVYGIPVVDHAWLTMFGPITAVEFPLRYYQMDSVVNQVKASHLAVGAKQIWHYDYLGRLIPQTDTTFSNWATRPTAYAWRTNAGYKIVFIVHNVHHGGCDGYIFSDAPGANPLSGAPGNLPYLSVDRPIGSHWWVTSVAIW